MNPTAYPEVPPSGNSGGDLKLVVDLAGPGWHVVLEVQPPPRSDPPRHVEFDVPAIGHSDGQLQRVSTSVLYTSALNRHDGWPDWHVKIYRCYNLGDAEMLRRHLHRQAVALQQANNRLPEPGRTAIEPPWAVVPVQMVRGDGNSEDLNGVVSTRLGIPGDVVAATLRRSLPDWFIDATQPELTLLAVSPRIELLPWEGYTRWPGTEHLNDFQMLAVGLDALHQLNWAHCDIKPDNVCRYSDGRTSGYVLIDTDAATPISPPTGALRSTPLYEYGGMRRWRLGRRPGQMIDPGVLRAQDRFGFAVVVLTALAGKDWVSRVLLHTDVDDPQQLRVADSHPRVVEELGRHWTDPRWQPLIAALAEPFGTKGQLGLESSAPWAVGWLARVIEAARGRPEPPPGRDLVASYTRDLMLIRQRVLARPEPRRERVRTAFEEIDRRAMAVALRAAAGTAALSAGLVLLVAAVVAYNMFGLRS